MKNRHGEENDMGASNFVRADVVEMRIARLEERLRKLEEIILGLTKRP